MKTLQTVLLAGLIACGLGCGYSSKAAPMPVAGSIPAISALVPASTAAGGPDFLMTVNGTSFAGGSTVNWNGKAQVTTHVSGSQLTTMIPAADIATAATITVTVTNPATPGTGGIYGSGGTTAETSSPKTFMVQ